MKKIVRFYLLTLFAATFIFPSYLPAKQIKLTYSNFFPPKHIQSILAQQWCDEIEKRTNGQVHIDYFPGQTLTKAQQTYDGVVSGLADIGLALFAYTRGRFPVMEAVDLPLGYTSGIQATKVANDVYHKFSPKELADTEVMYLHAHGPGLLHTANTPIRSMDDFNKIKLRGHGTTGKVIEALGGTPVSMPMPELYQSLQKGIVEGAMYPLETNKGWRMAEVVDYLTLSHSIAYTSTFYVVMNKQKWASIPADLQKTIKEINQEWIVKTGQAWDDSDKAGLEFFKSKGNEVIELSQAESLRWKKAVQPVIADYVDKMDKKGFNGKEIVDFVEASLEKNK